MINLKTDFREYRESLLNIFICVLLVHIQFYLFNLKYFSEAFLFYAFP